MRTKAKDPTGDCFAVAVQLARKFGGDVVHGKVTWRRKRIWHAWVEAGVPRHYIVFDEGQPYGVALSVYYRRLKPKVYARYTATEAQVNALKYGHWGPWEEEMEAETNRPQENPRKFSKWPAPSPSRAGGRVVARFAVLVRRGPALDEIHEVLEDVFNYGEDLFWYFPDAAAPHLAHMTSPAFLAWFQAEHDHWVLYGAFPPPYMNGDPDYGRFFIIMKQLSDRYPGYIYIHAWR